MAVGEAATMGECEVKGLDETAGRALTLRQTRPTWRGEDVRVARALLTLDSGADFGRRLMGGHPIRTGG
jgi:hypothetical protein